MLTGRRPRLRHGHCRQLRRAHRDDELRRLWCGAVAIRALSLGYTGELTDPSTGFVDLRARELDPTLGRFLSADTVQPNAPGSQGYNLYAYVANNPTTWTDPSGTTLKAC